MAKSKLMMLFVSFCLLSVFSASEVAPPAAIFIFGDSTVDVGTNTLLLQSGARADFSPNGVDFPYSVPTGRFSNGLNSADQIVKLFGRRKSPPPFLYAASHMSTFKRNILQGVNFASAGSGIFQDTGIKRWTEVVSLGNQIQQFAAVRGNFTEIVGFKTTDTVLSKSLFIISIGSNDLFELVEYFPNATDLFKAEHMERLQLTYKNHLKNLYKLGARKFGIISVPPIGCCPYARVQPNVDPSVCVKELNKLAQTFFIETHALLRKLSSDLKGMRYSLGNAYEMTMSIIQDPLAFGFKDVQSACCGYGRLNGEKACVTIFDPNLCSNRQEFLFWDLYHPTEFASQLAARTLYGAGTRYMTPMNFSQLVASY
ncbi:putative triacylglycerol lipase [Rosa chinensis]|uniref:Putative triacylglycerol lipase n=1 Tax=Rosa chinensis TaxID=74649 RepID=A0A2P6PMC3_ROSCH|nr:putative triacylglycerol lipase [Rosa chinensis]